MLWAMSSAVTVSLYVPGIVWSGICELPVLAETASQRRATGLAPSMRAISVRVLSEALTFRFDALASLKALAIEFDLHHGRLAGDDECLGLAIGVPFLIAKNQADRVSSILHVGRREEARLPDVFGRKIAKRLHQSERETEQPPRRWIRRS